MSSILLKIEEWIVKKEEELAKEGKVDRDSIQKQIDALLLYKVNIKDKCNKEIKDLEYLIDKLHWTKAYAIKCKNFLRAQALIN